MEESNWEDMTNEARQVAFNTHLLFAGEDGAWFEVDRGNVGPRKHRLVRLVVGKPGTASMLESKAKDGTTTKLRTNMCLGGMAKEVRRWRPISDGTAASLIASWDLEAKAVPEPCTTRLEARVDALQERIKELESRYMALRGDLEGRV